MRRVVPWLAALVAAGAALPVATASAGAPAMLLGFSDFDTFAKGNPAQWPLELDHLKATRATSMRVMWQWRAIEKTQPPDDASATDPGYAGYDFTGLDAVLRATVAAGVQPLLTMSHAPSWWEGPARPPVSTEVPAGTWKPNAAAFGRFMTAAARRYSGTYPDPLNPGAVLPRVRWWQLWNEPNLYVELTPQWTKTGKTYKAVSPGLYKALQNAGYDAVKSVASDNLVVTAGTAPFAEPWRGADRMPAAFFDRTLFCVSGRTKLKARNCRKDPIKFDVLAHHPYPIGPPGRKAINPDDVVIPDFAKLIDPMKVALKAGNIYPKTASKPVWATEMSWDSNPPDPGGIPAGQQAQYLAGAVYVLWRQGVRGMFWWNLRDDAPVNGSYAYSLQSGVFYRGATVAQDTPKPSFTAFRFPFVAYRAYADFRGHGSAKLWGMAPAPGTVSIQRLIGSSWKTIKSVTAQSDHVFQLRIAAGRGVRLRAVQAGEASVDAKVF